MGVDVWEEGLDSVGEECAAVETQDVGDGAESGAPVLCGHDSVS